MEQKWHHLLLLLVGILLLPALLVNLGSQAFIDDEGIRSLVAFEMLQSGDYIQATLNGEPYFKKPPLYNWILAGFFTLTGTINEWTARIPTVVFLLLFAGVLFGSVRRATRDTDLALVSALLALTCGRILFWDSFLGLIDICFSALIYTQFVALYFRHQRGDWRGYYVYSWLLAALAFLLKGLPGLVFQVLSVGGHLLWQRQWRKLFHPAHFLGAGLFLLIIGTYYALLLKGSEPSTIFGTLFHESAQRTPTHHGLGETILHLLAFPFKMSYHFLPWSLLLLFLFPLGTLRARLKEPFLQFVGVMFLVNIPVYWVSPQVYPRYLLMLAPLAFMVGYFLYRQQDPERLPARLFRGLFLGVGALLSLAAWLPLFLPQTREAAWIWPKTVALVALMGLAAYAMWRYRRLLIYALFVQLLTLRLAFDWFVIPDRILHDTATAARADARRIGEAHRDKSLYFLDEVCLETTSSFYLATSRGKVTPVWRQAPEAGGYYLVAGQATPPAGYQVADTMRIRHFHDRTPYVLLIHYPENPQ